MSVTRARALSLYRTILRVHRAALPEELRELGDTYVRTEFKAHKTAAPEFVPTFLAEWEKYVSSLSAQQGGMGGAALGRDLPAEDIGAMSDEQKQQLAALRQEAAPSATQATSSDLARRIVEQPPVTSAGRRCGPA